MQANIITTHSDLQTQTSQPEPARIAGIAPRAFWTPKAGNSETDYEDAQAVGTDCLAIADGATESSFARLWAQALTEGFVAQPSVLFPLHTERPEHCRARIQQWTQPLQAEWHSRIPWNTLPWFAEDKARAGAFATLLAFKINDERGMMSDEFNSDSSLIPHPSSVAFQTLAIGDSCLFQIRDGQVKMAFPLETSAQFDSTPPLLSSNPANNKRVWESLTIAEGIWEAGDILLFATDALARWFLAEVEAGNRPWDALCGLSGQEEFTALIARLRQERAMRNDDVTLVIVDSSNTALPPDFSAATDQAISASIPDTSHVPVTLDAPTEDAPADNHTDETGHPLETALSGNAEINPIQNAEPTQAGSEEESE